MFLAVGGTKFGYSVNGINWQFSTNGGSNNYRIARSPTGTLMVGQVTGYIRQSVDSGLNWSNTAFTGSSYGLIYSNIANLWISGAQSGYVYTSIDGSSWTSSRPATSGNGYALAESDSLIVMVSSSSSSFVANLYTSTNGTSWTLTSGLFEIYNNYYNLIYENSRFVLVGNRGTGDGNVYYSDNGTSWNAASGFTGRVRDVCWDGTQYVMVAEGGEIFISSNAQTWTVVTQGVNRLDYSNMIGISYANGVYVAISLLNKLYTSSNLTDWTVQNFSLTPLRDIITYGGNTNPSFYDHAHKLLTIGLSWLSSTFRLALVTNNYTFSETHTQYSDIEAYVITSSEMVGNSATNSYLLANNTYFTGVSSDQKSVILYADTTIDGIVNPLIAYLGLFSGNAPSMRLNPRDSIFFNLV